MNSPYKYYLETFMKEGVQTEIEIHRANAPNIKGKLIEAQEGGCVIAQDNAEIHHEASDFVFIAYEHIRGIAHSGWDFSKIC